MYTLLATIAAYLIGSISFAVIMSRLFGVADPRTYGSKNPGATNVLRSGNKQAAIATLLGDAFKGWFAVWLVKFLQDRFNLDDSAVALVAIAVFLGHLWPVFFRFIGGKGVATAAGVLLGLDLWVGLGTLATWLIIAYAFRYSSLAALVAAIFAPFFYTLLHGVDVVLFAVIAMSALLLMRHSTNIGNLLAGKESRIGSKSGTSAKGAPKKRT